MSLRVPALVVCLCLAPAALAQDAPAPAPKPLQFAWPVPSKATVTQAGVKKGNQVTLRYTIHLSDAGEELRLRFADLEFVLFNGQDMTSAEAKRAMAPQLASLRSSFPDLRVAKNGEFLGVVDWKAHVEHCMAALRAVAKEPNAAALAQTEQMMNDPRYKQMLEAKTGEFWQVWVGAWVEGEIASGETVEGVSQLPVGQTMIDAKLTFAHHGEAEEGLIRLSLNTLLDGEEARAAFLEVMRGMANMPPEEIQLTEFKKETRVNVLTDPKTLRPKSASSESRTRVTVNGATQTQLETRTYTFVWE